MQPTVSIKHKLDLLNMERNIRTIWEQCRAEIDTVTSEIQKLEEERDDLKKRLAINEAQQSKLCELLRVLIRKISTSIDRWLIDHG